MSIARTRMAWIILVLTGLLLAGPGPAARAADNPALGIGEPTTDPCGQNQCCNDPNCCKNPPCCKKPPCDCKGSGSPVNVKFGTLTVPFVDLEYHVGDVDFVIERSFISDDIYIGSFGKGVTSTLDQASISTHNGETGQELVVLRAAKGQRYEYLRQPDLSYTGPTGHYDILERFGDDFELTNEDGDVWIFDATTGWLLSKADRYGHTVTYHYNENGQPTSIDVFPDRTVTIHYGPNGLVESITDYAGRSVAYEYDGDGNLTRLTDAASQEWTYGYSSEGKLTSVVNPLGQTQLAVTYNSEGRVETLADVDGDVTYTYANGSTTKRDNALSTLLGTDINEVYYYDSEGVITRTAHADGTNSYQNYDALFSMTSSTEADNYSQSYHYDDQGRVTQIDYPDGSNKQYTWHPTLDLKTSQTDERGYVWTRDYDALGNLTLEVRGVGTPSETTMEWEYDAGGHLTRMVEPGNLVTTMGYDSYGQVTQRVVPGSVGHTFEYDLLGNVTRAADAEGNEIFFEYDSLSRATRAIDAAGNVSTRVYDAAGRMAYEDDTISGVSTYEYDGLGNTTRAIDGRGSETNLVFEGIYLVSQTDGLSRQVEYDYNPVGNLTKITRKSDEGDRITDLGKDAVGRATGVAGASGLTETRTYDNRRRLASVSRSDGLTQTYLYDTAGNLTQTTDYWGNTTIRGYDELNRVTTEADDYGTRYEQEWDPAGRVTKTMLPRGERTYEYDTAGRLTRSVDADGHANTFEYDLLGRRTAAERPGGERTVVELDEMGRLTKATRPSLRETSWTYEGLFNAATHAEAGGRVTAFEYDDTFAVTKMILPDTTEYAYGYDAGGRMTRRTLASGEAITAEYDDFNRTTKVIYPDLAETTLTYNDYDQITAVSATGAGTASYEYDSLGRVTSQTYDGRTVLYSYSADFKTVTVTYPSGLAVERQLDTLLRTSTITISGDPAPAVTYTYAADGVPATATYGSGVTTNYTFSGERFIREIVYTDSTAGLVRGWIRGTNDLGGTTYVERLDDATQSMQVVRDAENRVVGRLVGALDGSYTVPSPTRSESWTLDGLGNWDSYTLDGTTESRLHDLNNRITQRDQGAPVTFQYNANGALSDDGTYLYTSNYDGLLTEIRRKSDNSLVEQYFYGPLNRLVRVVTESGDEIEYVRDLEDRLLEVYVNDVLFSSHVHGGQLDELVCAIIGGTRYYYITDLGQNVAALTDVNGVVVESYEYDAYGAPQFSDGAGTPLTGSAVGNALLYRGRLYRETVGLYYYRARYMSPELGRFLSPDLMGINTEYAPNLYEFADSSPIELSDPYGLCTGCASNSITIGLGEAKFGGLKIGRWGVTVNLEGGGETKICRKCCKGGSCGVEVSGSLQFGGGASATFDVTPPIGGPAFLLLQGAWKALGGKFGFYVTVSGSYTQSKEWSADSCTGKSSSKSCSEAKVSATAQGGASTPTKASPCKAEAWLYGGGSYTYSCCTTSGSGGSSTKCQSCLSGKIGFKGSVSCDLFKGWGKISFGSVGWKKGFDITIWEPKKSCW